MATLTEEMKQYIASNLGYVATVDASGNPDIGPKMSLRVLDDSHLIFNEMTGKTIMNDLDQNGTILAAFANLGAMRGYRFGGKATLYRSGQIFDDATNWAKENKHPLPKAAVVIDIDTIWTLDAGPKAGELYKAN